MAYVMIEHKIGKWEEFERIFRDDVERRRMLGSKGGKVFRNVKDPENILHSHRMGRRPERNEVRRRTGDARGHGVGHLWNMVPCARGRGVVRGGRLSTSAAGGFVMSYETQ